MSAYNDAVYQAVEAINDGWKKNTRINPYGDGKAAEKIINCLLNTYR